MCARAPLSSTFSSCVADLFLPQTNDVVFGLEFQNTIIGSVVIGDLLLIPDENLLGTEGASSPPAHSPSASRTDLFRRASQFATCRRAAQSQSARSSSRTSSRASSRTSRSSARPTRRRTARSRRRSAPSRSRRASRPFTSCSSPRPVRSSLCFLGVGSPRSNLTLGPSSRSALVPRRHRRHGHRRGVVRPVEPVHGEHQPPGHRREGDVPDVLPRPDQPADARPRDLGRRAQEHHVAQAAVRAHGRPQVPHQLPHRRRAGQRRRPRHPSCVVPPTSSLPSSPAET